MSEETRPQPPFSGIIYGEIIYWGTIFGSVISIIASALAFMYASSNVMDPASSFSAIWQGQASSDIWIKVVGAAPKGHWYLANIANGDAVTMLGMAIGVFSVIPGMFASTFFLFKNKQVLYGFLAFIGGLIVLSSALGMITVPE